jgi:hypothetical protein
MFKQIQLQNKFWIGTDNKAWSVKLQPEAVSYRIIEGKDCVLSPCVLSSCGLPLPPTCLLVTVNEARSYFASTIRGAVKNEARDNFKCYIESCAILTLSDCTNLYSPRVCDLFCFAFVLGSGTNAIYIFVSFVAMNIPICMQFANSVTHILFPHEQITTFIRNINFYGVINLCKICS